MALSLYHLIEGRIKSFCLLALMKKKQTKNEGNALPPAQKIKVEN